MRLYLASRVSTLYLCTKDESIAPLHVATLTVQRELPKYEASTLLGIKPSGPTLCDHYLTYQIHHLTQCILYIVSSFWMMLLLSTVAADTKTTPLHLAVSFFPPYS